MQMLGGVLVAAVAVIAVAIAISASSNGGAPVQPTSPQAKNDYTAVATLLKGIPQTGTTLGNPKASVTIDYYGDLECPICRAFTLGLDGGGFPQLIANQIRAGKVKVVYKSFCTATCNNHPRSTFNLQQGLADQIPNLDMTKWQTDQGDPALLNQVEGDEQSASNLGLQGTPTLIAIGAKGETLVNGGNFPTYSTIQQAISKVE